MMKLAKAALLLILVAAAVWAQVNAGQQKPEASLPFTMTTVATFKLPWRLAFLPDGRMLVTEKVGPVWLVTQQGEKIQVENTPAVYFSGQVEADREASGKLWRSVSLATDFAASGPIPEFPPAKPGNPTQWMLERYASAARQEGGQSKSE